MKQSELFTKTSKTAPSDEVSKNAQLLIRAGYIHKELAGVYTLLPLGHKVFNNIVGVIREEMNAIGGQELEMTALQDGEVWQKSGRWINNPDVDVWFTTKLKNDTELGLGFTHEEPITNMMTKFIQSYRDLPVLAYQFQKKFRNETRAKSGIMRTREFVMKDLYSFCKSEAEQLDVYEKVKRGYVNIFNRLGIGEKTFVTFASGGVFSKYSHEFQTLTDAGEDDIYISDEKKIAINKEVLNDEVLNDLGLKRENLRVEKAVEVGNIFNLGTRFSDAMGLEYSDENGQKQKVWMGSYGIGPARVMGTIVEVLSDENGIVWPASVAPFALHMVTLFKDKNEEAYKVSQEIYNKLKQAGVEVLWDDREGAGAGEKFADADLLGMPMRVTISHKSLLAGGVELKERRERDNSKAEIISVEHLLTMYTKEC
jgi:prolyl-tRNA synthetase